MAVLAPLAKASQFLEGKTYPTSNLVLPSIFGCIQLLHADTPVKKPWNHEIFSSKDLRPEVQRAREALYQDMVKRWQTDMSLDRKRFYMIATVCDPRQKALRFPGISGNDRETAQDWFEAEYLSLWAAKDPACAPQRSQRAAGTTREDARRPRGHPQHEGASFLDFMMDLAQANSQIDEDTNVLDEEQDGFQLENEARKYLALSEVPMSTNILEWWASHEQSFPNLSRMAQQYLGVPATSASAERLFSIAGLVYDDLRQNMKDELLESIMWARINSETRLAKRT